MNLFETNECVQFFLELYPTMTSEQAVALRDGVALLEISPEAFKASARAVVLKHSYVNNAIPALIESITAAPRPFTAPPREMTWVDAANERNAEERFRTTLGHALDDLWIESAPPELVNQLIEKVADGHGEPIRAMWKKKGLASRAVRCAVAARLREAEGDT